MRAIPLEAAHGTQRIPLGALLLARSRSGLDAWAGLSAGGPFDGAGAALKADWWVARRMSLDLRARLGYNAGQHQNGVSVGLGYAIGRR